MLTENAGERISMNGQGEETDTFVDEVLLSQYNDLLRRPLGSVKNRRVSVTRVPMVAFR